MLRVHRWRQRVGRRRGSSCGSGGSSRESNVNGSLSDGVQCTMVEPDRVNALEKGVVCM